ncbi:MAG: hypothetical protein NXI04_08675 [Planctomycetaceae bacterium]|nr:hypothetical protein [Planctomycetaceae bacterium]
MLVSRFPIPTAVGVATPITTLGQPATKSPINPPRDAREEVPLQRRLARLKVWLN